MKTYADKFLTVFVISFVFLAMFATTSLAAGAVADGEGSVLDLLRPVYDAFANGEYWYAGSLALVVAVATARKFGGEHVPFLRTEAGTALLLLLGSFGAALAARLAGGVELTGEIALDSTKIAFLAAGGYAAFKALVVDPLLAKALEKWPRLASPLQLVVGLFRTSGNLPKAVVATDNTKTDAPPQ